MQSPQVVIAHGEDFAQTTACAKLKSGPTDQTRPLRCQLVHSVEEVATLSPAVLVLDPGLLHRATLEQWRQVSTAVLVLEEGAHRADAEADLIAARGFPEQATLKLLRFACQRWVLQRDHQQLQQMLADKHGHLGKMADIGVALSAEKDLTRLLSKILTEGQRLARCDASSLFLVDRSDEHEPKLTFKLTQNNSILSPFKEQQLPLTQSSIAGYVALTNQELNIADTYDLPEGAPYSHNDSFDVATGYRCVSLIAIPMCNYRHEVVGVLEFINRKKDADQALTDPSQIPQQVLPFDEDSADMLRALAGQAAVAIENRRLLDSINELFEGFVQASVYAIEQRDPTTSGHSFRVADLCVHLAKSLTQSQLPRYRDLWFSQDEICEIRFAALLHDFGKVGVREHVLTKGKKLPESSIERLRYRVALAKETLRSRTFESLLRVYDSGGAIDAGLRAQKMAEMAQEQQKLDQYLAWIIGANEPTILPAGSFEHLQEIHRHQVPDHRGNWTGLIDEVEFKALSIRKGSLTEAERLEIESHVVHTLSFLELIPWTSELQRIPAIAGAHHEKLDGSGYPDGLVSEQIPLPSKIMTVCDIYDALTASDRPYKAAMPKELALSVLEEEAQCGMLDTDIVKVFIEAKSYEAVSHTQYISQLGETAHHHHVCDHEVEHLQTPQP